MKSIFITFILYILSVTVADAQVSMRDLWIQMPDSIVPYLNNSVRTEMADLYQMKVKAESRNLLEGTSVIDTLTSDYMRVSLNSNSVMQIKQLPTESSFVICVIKTFIAPEAESEVAFFNPEWKPLKESYGLPLSDDADKIKKEFTFRPDTMTPERFDELLTQLDPIMLHSEVLANENVVVFELSQPLLSKEDKVNINAIIKQRKFKWNGQTFIEC